MSGIFVEVLREVVLRINSGYSDLGLKHLQVLSKPERLQPDMTPYIQILPDTTFITENYGASIQQNRKDATINLVLWVEYPALRDSENPTWQTSYLIDGQTNNIADSTGFLIADNQTTGFINWLEKLLDYLNTTSQSILNPQIVNTPTRSMAISVNNVQKNELTISAEISLSIQTQPFIINNRQNI